MLTNTVYGHAWNCNNSHIAAILSPIVAPYYHQPHRHYHTTDHIVQMYDDAEVLLGWELTCEEIIAIAYHDIIWVASDDAFSVRASADMVKKHHELGMFDELAGMLQLDVHDRKFDKIVCDAADIVRDTHHHTNTAPDINSSRVIDLDMFGFSQRDRQLKILSQLQREYGPGFLTGRASFLQMMLARKPFYLNLSEHYSQQAYANILAELTNLMGE